MGERVSLVFNGRLRQLEVDCRRRSAQLFQCVRRGQLVGLSLRERNVKRTAVQFGDDLAFPHGLAFRGVEGLDGARRAEPEAAKVDQLHRAVDGDFCVHAAKLDLDDGVEDAVLVASARSRSETGKRKGAGTSASKRHRRGVSLASKSSVRSRDAAWSGPAGTTCVMISSTPIANTS